MNEFDKIFDDTEANEEVEQENHEEDDEVVTKNEEVAESEGEEKEVEEKTEVEPPATEENKQVPISALMAERNKAKEYKQKFSELKEKYEPDEDEPDPVEDPQGYKEYVKQKVLKESQQERINLARDNMIQNHTDYEEMEKTFIFLSYQDPSLIEQMNSSINPAEFAYQKGKEYKEQQRNMLLEEINGKKTVENPKDIVKKTALSMPNLNNATSKNNAVHVEKLLSVNEMFDDTY